MPPRRSSRSARPSAEQEASNSAKRKRTDADDVEEKENAPGARRTSTRGSVGPSSKVPAAPSSRASARTSTRTSARPSRALQEVAETEEDEEEPVKKKSRNSVEGEDDDEDEIVELQKPRRGRVKKTVQDDDDDEVQEVKPSRKSSMKPRPTRSRKAAAVEDSDVEEVKEPTAISEDEREEIQEVKPAKPKRGRTSRKVPEDDDDDIQEIKPAPKAKGRKPKVTNKVEDDDEAQDIKPTKPKPAPRSRKPVKPETNNDEHNPITISSDESDATPAPRSPKVSSNKQKAMPLLADIEVTPRPRKSAPATPPKHPSPTTEDNADDLDGFQEEFLQTPRRVPRQSQLSQMTPKRPAPPEEEEEEISLLEPRVKPVSVMRPPPAEEPSGPKPRLVIHKMVLINFKSYAGRQEIGPFHKSFSSIVGPNGSGKSNTIDALLFVFGYRASKMRQGKLSELIHNSARYPDLDECSVEVHFREIIDLPGPDAYSVVPNSSLVVARTATKSNNSRYTLNSRSSTYTEVQTLLQGRGIDLTHKRFLILQGEVESIAQMKPKGTSEHDDGLLEYLEDIIGTAALKAPIESALAEVDRLGEERAEKVARLRIVEKEKAKLDAERKEALAWLKLANEHVRALSRLWQYYLWKCLENDEQFAAQIEHLEKELEDERERNKDDITHLELLETHYKEREKAYEEVKTAAEEAAKDNAAREKQSVSLEERRKHASAKAKKLKKALADDEQSKKQADNTIQDSDAKIKAKKREIAEHEANLEKEEKVLEGIRDSLKDKTQVFHEQIEAKQKELQPWTAKINVKQAAIDVASSERDALAKKATGLKDAVTQAEGQLVELQVEQEGKLNELNSLRTKKAEVQKKLRTCEEKFHAAQAGVQELRSKASSLRQKSEEARASQAASTSQNRVLDSLTKLKQTGRIDGFHGRLGSLGTIPDKYDVAVSTACGSLNNMVVDTVAQGQACIEFLRKQNIGRASFMVLEKLPTDRLNEHVVAPEGVPRLFDLIKPRDPRFASAFYKGVGNTLVADNLDQANRIAFGGSRRWRVVTLAGQLIDSSGTMSGGGNHVSRGGMSSKLQAEAVSPQVLKNYEQESEQAARSLEAAQQELRDIEAEAERLTQAGPEIELDIEKLTMGVNNGKKKRLTDAERRVQDLKAQSKPNAKDLARINTLDAEIASSTEELEELQTKTGAIEAAIKNLEKKILEIGGSKLLKQKSTVDGIRLLHQLANEEVTKAEVMKATAEKNIVKYTSGVETNRAALEEVEKELEELKDQLAEVAQYLEDLKEKVEAAQAAQESSKDDLDQLKQQLQEKREEIDEFRKKELEITQKLTDKKKESAENERVLDHWRTEHDQLKLHEIDDDDDDDEEEGADQVAGASGSGEGAVKQEHADSAPPKKARQRSPSTELYIYSADELARFKKRDMLADSEYLDEKLKNTNPNLNVLKEYKKREEEFMNRAKDLEETTAARDAQKQLYDGLRKQRLDEFMAGFSSISLKLKEMYQMITLGGNAELELVDSMDPFSEGIIFSVMPPKKSWKNISNLSGGEKTLSSLALVFALHVFKPTPLYFMDEIDAALDFRNVSIVANYIKDRTKNAQFIIISLRNDMFELSHRLIGIYKTANATQSISIDNHALARQTIKAVPTAAA
ncbi:RecF/RecN/SMC N terminal domain-containing protein [Suillus subalutaceus]|uniref:RecF/RecN/SMC N terminal domain-containing protein n=1 Tax=Suillus subalutaceus TaxID=48586 RepID=UPI001B864EB9|nr:RecF/RecN/SMC N terminal domain-containing protein [Suillus subalutaceus]KAG1842247.1 RecF/RecN/SMC N terminal domain-containing protein [Suillus subalutaceus]